MGIGKLVDIQNLFIMLVAPPAWGKTRKLIHWFGDSSLLLLVYISPLRALADEVEEAFHSFTTLNLKSQNELTPFLEMREKRVLILTPERVNQGVASKIENCQKVLIFLDEFHLFYMWKNFRPKMWECLENVSTLSHTVMGVTATLENKIKDNWYEHTVGNFEHSVWLDLGNYELKKYPEQIYQMVGNCEKYIEYLIRVNRNNNRVVLCFCAYRQQVHGMTELFRLRKLKAIGCVGGETKVFIDDLKRTPDVQVIFSTVALSHGVNLPDICDIVFLYHEKNPSYFLQMSARAGRHGENYSIYIQRIERFKVREIKQWIKLKAVLPFLTIFAMLNT